MKRRFSKILGVGLTLSLLVSLLLTAAPVLADVSQPTVDLLEEEISVAETYTLSFRINTELPETTGTITVRFPEDTDVSGVAAIATVSYTSGIGHDSGTANGVAVDDPDDPIVTITLPDLGTAPLADAIGAMAYVQVVITGVDNPTEPGDYTLEVMTSAEDDYVVSEVYEIGVPTVGGFVYVYNPSNILLATYGGKGALNTAAAAPGYHFTKADYTIKVGPGTYELEAGTITISGEGLTLESSDGAENTIIDASLASRPAFHITADDVIVDGFTLDGNPQDGIWIFQYADDVTVQNNIFFEGEGSAIVLQEASGTEVVTGATISDNVFEDCYSAITVLSGATDNTISDNTITGCTDTITAITIGGGSSLALATHGNTITGNTITNNDGTGIWLFEWGTGNGFLDDNEISGNTISENEGNGIKIASTADDVTKLQILNNYIADNEGDGILIESWAATGAVISNVIKFNTITGNGDDGINNGSGVDVDATFNWWGTTVSDDIADMFTGADDVTYEPFLTDTAEAAIAGGKAAASASSLDAKDEAGVKVSGVVEDPSNGTDVADIISALKYAANPEDALDDAIAFYDVYVVLPTAFVLDADVTAKLKFYDSAITTGSTAYFWTGDFWAECSDQEARDGIIYVDVSDDTLPALDELEETIFAVIAGEAVLELDAPVIAAPESGAEDVSLKPTLAWGTVADALGYDFVLADNPLFVLPIASLTGDLARLITPFYQQVAELEYSNYYYWRVKAVSADAESAWSAAVFMTVAEVIPEPEVPPVWMCSEGLTFASRAALEAHLATAEAHQPVEPPEIIVKSPDVIVPLPAETPITPAWIYVIIGVGAVLIIGLIVLIVRTRRVA